MYKNLQSWWYSFQENGNHSPQSEADPAEATEGGDGEWHIATPGSRKRRKKKPREETPRKQRKNQQVEQEEQRAKCYAKTRYSKLQLYEAQYPTDLSDTPDFFELSESYLVSQITYVLFL